MSAVGLRPSTVATEVRRLAPRSTPTSPATRPRRRADAKLSAEHISSEATLGCLCQGEPHTQVLQFYIAPRNAREGRFPGRPPTPGYSARTSFRSIGILHGSPP